MHQTTRQGKFHIKLQSRTKEKSALPEIDPFHGNSTKYADSYGYKGKNRKDTVKIVKDKTQDPFLSTKAHLKAREIEPYINAKKILSQQQNEPGFGHTKYIKKASLDQQKQLMTADTIRTQLKYQAITSNTKQPEGLDMWTLNNNLKQFSETRKLPFYKMRQQKRDLGQREIQQQINKAKTQDIRSMQKIYGGGEQRVGNSERQKSQGQMNFKKLGEQMKKPKLTQKDAKSHSTINARLISPLGNTLYGTLPVRKNHSNLDTTFYKKQKNVFVDGRKDNTFYKKQQNSFVDGSKDTTHYNKQQNSFLDGRKAETKEVNPYLRTFINGSHLKRENSNRNIHILEMGGFGAREKRQENRGGNVRRNRFELVQQDKAQIYVENQDILSKVPSKSLNSPSYPQPHDQQTSSQTSQPSSSHTPATALPSFLPMQQQKKKHYEYMRSIQRINKSLLKSSENYFQQYHTFASMPNSKIEFYIDSLSHPDIAGTTVQYKSMWRGEVFEDGFGFAEPNKERERPKKKEEQVSAGKGKMHNLSKKKINF